MSVLQQYKTIKIERAFFKINDIQWIRFDLFLAFEDFSTLK